MALIATLLSFGWSGEAWADPAIVGASQTNGHAWEMWQVLVMIGSQLLLIVAALWGLIRWGMGQYQDRIDQKFAHMQEMQGHAEKRMLQAFDSIGREQGRLTARIDAVEKSLSEHKLHVATNFIDRESTLVWWGQLMARMEKIARVLQQQNKRG